MPSPSTPERYAGARAVIATMHGKELAVTTPFLSHLRVHIITPEHIDTDRYGCFCGALPREGTIVDAARLKAREAMTSMGLPLGLASEGAFSPSTTDPSRYVGHEVLLFIDDDRNFEAIEEEAETPCNFRSWCVGSAAELPSLECIDFPTQRLTVRPNDGDLAGLVFSGIGHGRVLEMAIELAASQSGDALARVETDMRAHQNPTRMGVLQQLAERLAQRLASGG